jgi:archaellum component FlaG (FlaF/FlaG flagellin family)
MKSFLKAAALGLCCAGTAAALWADGTAPQPAPLERAALRAVARTKIRETVEHRAVRRADPAALDKEARRIAGRLSDAQLHALAAGEDVEKTIAPSLTRVSAQSLGESTSNLLFVPIPPCRIIDTRLAGGKLQPGVVRDFQVVGDTEFQPQGGHDGGCGLPPGGAEPDAAAVVINFVAVTPEGSGNLRAWAYGQPVPLAAVINYDNLGPFFSIANGIIVPIDGTTSVPADLSVRADFNATHLVADVTGYFTRFPVEQFQDSQKSITVVADGGQVDLSSGACTSVNSCSINANAPGQVIVRAWAEIQLNHGTNVGGDRIAVGVKNIDPTICSNNDQSINASDFEIPDSLPASPAVQWTMSHKRIFVHNNSSGTYYINARMVTGAGPGDVILSSRMICTFIPD